MLRVYAPRDQELRLLPYLAEFKARVIVNYPIKGITRKIKGKNAYKIVSFPIDHICSVHGNHSHASDNAVELNPCSYVGKCAECK